MLQVDLGLIGHPAAAWGFLYKPFQQVFRWMSREGFKICSSAFAKRFYLGRPCLPPVACPQDMHRLAQRVLLEKMSAAGLFVARSRQDLAVSLLIKRLIQGPDSPSEIVLPPKNHPS